jgi:16S rRNA (cytidine1402-2'-O)-methyltransferase
VHALAGASAEADRPAFDATLRTLLGELPLKQAVALTAELSGAPRNAVYERALVLKNADE